MPYNILLVDDDRAFREEFREALEDYAFIEASTGQEALEILKKPNEIDLVILDVMMPGMKGTEVLKDMKRIAPDLGIIILTGYSSKDIAVDALKGHADDYMEKPVRINTAKEVIEKILCSKEGNGEAYDTHGNVERVKRFIERNFHKKVSLVDAAMAVSLSPKYLSRIFRQEAGVGFSDFKSQVKIENAKKWLTTTGYNVNQISDKLGYENVESFIRTFKKYAGATPSEYRKKIQKMEK